MPLTVQTTACRGLINLQILYAITLLNTLRPRQNDQLFTHDIFKRIFFNGNVWSAIKISLKFVSKRPINTIPALVQTVALRRPGDMPSDEPLTEAMLVISPSHIYVIRPQWVSKLSAPVWGEMVGFFPDLFIDHDAILTPVSSGSLHGLSPDGTKPWVKLPLTGIN